MGVSAPVNSTDPFSETDHTEFYITQTLPAQRNVSIICSVDGVFGEDR